MFKQRRFAYAALLAAATLMAVPAWAAPAEAPEGPVNIELLKAPLSQVVQLLAADHKINIVFDDPTGTLADKQVGYINIKGKSVDTAIRLISTSAGVFYERDPDGIYHLSSQPFTPPVRMAPPVDLRAVEPAEPAELILEKMVLGYVPWDTALKLLLFSHRGARSSIRPSQATSLDQLDLYPGIVDPTTGNWYMPGHSLPGAPLISPVLGNLLGGATGANQFGGMGGFGGGMGGGMMGGGMGGGMMGGMGGGMMGGGMGGMGGGMMGGGMGGMGGGMMGGGGGGGALLPEGIQQVVGYYADNSLLVRGTPEAIQELKQILRLIDIPPRQIVIEVQQIAVNSTYQKSLGIDWSLNNNDVTVDSALGLSTGGTINVGVLGNGWRINMAAAVADGKATVINSTKLSTMNMELAFLSVTSITWVFLPVINQVQGAGATTSLIPTPLSAPNFLFIQPRVNADNTITMSIPFNLTRQLGESVGPNGERAPNQVFTTIQTIRRVASGQTVVVGGTIERNDSVSSSGIPILKDLPLIGPLFRSKLQRKDNTETLYFFTPTLLPEDVAIGGEPNIQ